MSDPVREARTIQHAATGPRQSFLVEAAAGSGKTKVLVDRFLRLCLADPGVDPRAILAITFTRRATVEIQARLQRAARRLAGLEPAALEAELTDILGQPPSDRERERAAWFHEALLEDPRGLGIDTLHAFCQKVLGRFAAEVGLDPRFAVLDDRQEADYRAEALDRLESELARDPQAAAAYAALAPTARGARGKVAALFAWRMQLQRWVDRVAPPDGPVAAALGRPLAPHQAAVAADLHRALLAGTPWADDPDPRPSRLASDLAAALAGFADTGLAAVLDAEAPQEPTAGLKKKVAEWRTAALDAADQLALAPESIAEHAETVRDLMLTKGGDLRKPSGRKPTAAERHAAFADACAPVLAVLSLPPLLDLLVHDTQLLAAALRAVDLYAALKRRDRVVDFQDLEYLALRLLTDAEVGSQVHFRLDARLDHLLLDEFQDTNRNQAELLAPLIDEVLAGGDPPRTVFVVGDPKQSIYGFRGAEPDIFRDACRQLAVRAGEEAIKRLPTNFRSLSAVVEAVGELFTREPLGNWLGEDAAGAEQRPARSVDPGRVVFVDPIDADPERSGHERAAAAVATLVQELLAPGAQGTWAWDAAAGRDEPRTLRRDDILILARTKTHLGAYEGALRRAGIPFLPAGRGLLARSREIQDILALLRWLVCPVDDTAGATVLRSPCFRLPEPQVQELLAERRRGRRRSLREVLRDRDDLGEVADCLEGWFRLAGLLPLHDLLRRVVRDGDLLQRFEVAGGEQARFNLLRLFDLALAAEGRGGSLRDFVAELERAEQLGGEEEGALPGEEGSGRVRVMTVHGAKGLEAPVVILVDAAHALRDDTATLLLGDAAQDGPWALDVRRSLYEGPQRSDGERLPVPLSVPRARALARARAEDAHVLYVAMTRARDRLWVVGGRGRTAGDDGYLGWLAAADPPAPDETGRWQAASTFLDGRDEPAVAAAGAEPDRRAVVAAFRLRTWSPPPLAPRFALDAPSRLDDDRTPSPVRHGDPADDPDAAAAPPGRRDTVATRRGTRIHAWLERACRFGAFPPPPAAAADRAEWDEARAVWEDGTLAWIFQPEAHGGRGFCEVPVLHRRREPDGTEQRVTGFIDRLVLQPGRVDIVDYKSNRITQDQVADFTDHYRRQLAAYRDALQRIHPDREVRCWLVWTTPALAAARLTEAIDP